MTPHRSLPLAATAALLLVACGGKHKPAPVSNAKSPQPLAVALKDPKLITMTAEPTTSLVAASATSELAVRVRIDAGVLPTDRRLPLNLGLVLDTSGSMDGKGIDELRKGAHELVTKMKDGDRISVVAFHSRAEVLVPGTKLDPESRKRILSVIDGIKATGTTDLAAGLAAGLQQVQAGQGVKAIHRIVLFSDGVPNPSPQLPSVVASVRQYGFSITTLGFGIDYDTTLMDRLARDTGGTFHYIEKPAEVVAVFDSELTRMTTLVGRNLVLTLEPGPGVTFQPMPGLLVGADGKAYATLGDLPAGEARDLMIPIKVAARSDQSTAELVDAQLAFDDVINQSGRQQRTAFVGVKASTDIAEVRRSVKINLEVQRIRTAAASAILEAIALARQGQIAPAQQRIAAAIVVVRAVATRLNDPELEKIIRELDELAKQIAQMVVPQQQIIVGGNDKATPDEGMKGRLHVDGRDTITPTSVTPMSVTPATAPPTIEINLRHMQDRAKKTVSGEKKR